MTQAKAKGEGGPGLPGSAGALSVFEPGPEGRTGRDAGRRAAKQGREPGAAPSPAGAEPKAEALPHGFHSSPCRCSAASSAGGGCLL